MQVIAATAAARDGKRAEFHIGTIQQDQVGSKPTLTFRTA